MSLEKITAYKCLSCDTISEDCEDEPLYECGSCGTNFLRSNSDDGDSHRCPNCHKFGSKIADQACTSCQEGEVEEIQAIKCSVCEEIMELVGNIPSECPKCKEDEMNKKELEKIKATPVEQRGGQKSFATIKDAQEAYSKFINSIHSEHISLAVPENHDFKTEQKDGITWIEFPKPYVCFSFETKLTIHDKYLKDKALSLQGLNDLFFNEVEKVSLEYLKGTPHWNMFATHGFVMVEK
jgi:DNA-directed RNA polymerase subunit RPC12/RpoP/phage FluMu protein Com